MKTMYLIEICIEVEGYGWVERKKFCSLPF
jgi:hypothetical protein